jgi:Domain of unknown function (DUF3854)
MTHTVLPQVTVSTPSYGPIDLHEYRDPKHLADFESSLIDLDIIRLNFRSIDQTEAFHFLKPNLQPSDRRNDGRLRDGHLRAFSRLEASGWVCQGVDPLTMNLSQWGCLKPNDMRWDSEKRKRIKYEHPYGVPTELFCLRVTYRIGLKISKTQSLEAEIQYLDRMVDVDPDTEDRGFWQWVLDNPALNIIITEGAKKAASLLSAGYLAIALPGIYGAYRSKINGVDCIPHLIPQLKIFTSKGREFVFAFDNDTNPNTVKNVRIATTKTARLLKRNGCDVSVTSWLILPYKGVDDLIAGLGVDAFTEAFKSRQSIDNHQLNDAFSIADLTQLTVDVRYLNPTVRPDDIRDKIIALKSAKGTGKTEVIYEYIKPDIDRGRSVLIITHRIQLAKELARRLGIDHISEVRDETGGLMGYALCADSLHPESQARFDPDGWDDAIVVIDECEQVIWHMLNSATCLKNRVAILQTFSKLMQNVATSGGTVVLSDADLSKVSIDYIQKLTGNQLDLWLLNNVHNPNKGKRQLFTHKSPDAMLAAAHSAIESGDRLLIHCSAQKAKSKFGTQNIETILANKFPTRSILRIDSDTVKDRSHPAYGCIERINDVVAKYDIVIASPTIETGISLDRRHFSSVWCFANGVQTVDAVCQTLERERNDVPRHICITTGGINKIGNGSESIYSLSKCEGKLHDLNYRELAMADAIASDDIVRAHLQAWASYAAKTNQGFNSYEQNILAKLALEGYEIVPYSIDPDDEVVSMDEVTEAIETARADNYQAERDGKIDEPNPSDFELAALKKKASKTKQERHREAKGLLCRRYLTEDITHDLISKDDDGWYPQLQLHYYLSIGREHLKGRDTAKLKGLSPDGFMPFAPDVNRSCLSLKIKALDAVNVQQFFGEDKTFTSADLAGWHEKLLQCRRDIKEYLGISITTKSTPIQTAQRLLGLLGMKLNYIDQIRIDGTPTRRYSGVDCNADERQSVMDRWLDRDNRIAGMAKCHTTLLDLYNGSDVTDLQLEFTLVTIETAPIHREVA